MTLPTGSPATCPSCAAVVQGPFCSTCGAAVSEVSCPACKTVVAPGARFCHRCGAATQSGPSARAATGRSTVPWIVAAVAVLALLATLAGRSYNSRRGSALDAPQNALPQAGLDDRAGGVVRGPDISSMSAQERADRLFNRVMTYATQGKSDSVQFFAPMAISAYQMLAPLNTDQRYDLGRVAEVSGAIPLARAQADTILRAEPQHLLGLILASRVATDDAAREAIRQKLLAAEKIEMGKRRDEYTSHRNDIDAALADARRGPVAR